MSARADYGRAREQGRATGRVRGRAGAGSGTLSGGWVRDPDVHDRSRAGRLRLPAPPAATVGVASGPPANQPSWRPVRH
eukprot:4595770-Pleurochrysis_carterae.AAC.1